jgi:hypothetical protein
MEKEKIYHHDELSKFKCSNCRNDKPEKSDCYYLKNGICGYKNYINSKGGK